MSTKSNDFLKYANNMGKSNNIAVFSYRENGESHYTCYKIIGDLASKPPLLMMGLIGTKIYDKFKARNTSNEGFGIVNLDNCETLEI